MIARLEARNFQSHKHTVVDFHEGVNALVGLSDAGKSAVLRMLIWVTTNRPDGEEFRSYWGGDTTVTITLMPEGVKVTRGRTNSDNYYILEVPGQKEQPFRAFGRGVVPEEIAAVLRINEDVNIGRQMDPPFLIAMKSGEVAQELNKAVNLEVIDRSLSAVRSKKVNADQRLRAAEGQISAAQEAVQSFDYLERMEADVVRLEGLRFKLKDKTAALQGLIAQIEKIRQVRQKHEGYLAVLAAKPTLDTAFNALDRQREAQQKITRITAILGSILDAEDDVKRFELLAGASAVVEAAMKKVDDLKDVTKRVIELSRHMENIRSQQGRVQDLKEHVADLTEELRAETPDDCPFCGRPIEALA